jgi:hypothetical protein
MIDVRGLLQFGLGSSAMLARECYYSAAYARQQTGLPKPATREEGNHARR